MVNLPLNSTEREQGAFTERFNLTNADFTQTAANTAQVITLRTLPAGALIKNVAVRLRTAFADTADAGFNSTAITIGDSGSANRFLTTTELNLNGSAVYNKAGTGVQQGYDGANSLLLTVNSMTGKSLSNLKQGDLVVLLELAHLNQLAN